TMKFSVFRCIIQALIFVSLAACNRYEEEHPEIHKIVVTSPQAKSITVTQQYVCQIHSQRHIKIRILDRGYLEEISIKEGQEVKKGDVMFKIVPVVYQAKLDAETAAKDVERLELQYSQKLSDEKVVSKNEVALHKAKLAQAQSKVQLAEAELSFATVKAPFDGIIDRLNHQQGGLVEEGDALTTLSDNRLMWVYFNVPEASYLEYMTEHGQHQEDLKIELKLANGKKFSQIGKIGAIEGEFNNTTGNISFRADFPNPDLLLRHGQTGKVLINRVQNDALVIPQRATFQILDKRYVYVIDKEDVAHQREVEVQNELDDIFVIKAGLGVNDKIVLEGAREIHDGDKVEYEERAPEQVLANLKYHAE
ncbi:MAG: bepF 5, partial [Planctomycetaceae bacterium]|nr:bepF 5 [Planctomycetaceae bacterium]